MKALDMIGIAEKDLEDWDGVSVALAVMQALVAEIEKHAQRSKLFEVLTIDSDFWDELKYALEETV